MLSFFISLLGILFTIFFVIGTHEAAHFITARLLRIKVLRFSIGFGKTLFRWEDKSGTEYIFALIPLGGYVKMLDEHEGTVSPEDLHLAFNRQPFYKKFLVIAAGPLTNILCAFILYWIVFMIGFVAIKPIIGEITPQSIAAEAGLKPSQEIVRIDQKPTRTWMAAIFRILSHTGDQDQMSIETRSLSSNQVKTHLLDLTHWQMNELMPDPLGSLGITPLAIKKITPDLLNHIQYGPIGALSPAWQQMIDLTAFNFLLFGKMVTGKISLQSLGGPITIFESAGAALNYGLLPFIGFLAFLSVSIGVINLLPIPGLDGGHLVIQVIEFILRKPIPLSVIFLLYRLGFIFLIVILIQALANDILRL